VKIQKLTTNFKNTHFTSLSNNADLRTVTSSDMKKIKELTLAGCLQQLTGADCMTHFYEDSLKDGNISIILQYAQGFIMKNIP